MLNDNFWQCLALPKICFDTDNHRCQHHHSHRQHHFFYQHLVHQGVCRYLYTAVVAFVQILENQKHKTIRETINGLPGIISFFHDGKGSWGHVLNQYGPRWPTWNIPKKCISSLLKGHFQSNLITLNQGSITHVSMGTP